MKKSEALTILGLSDGATDDEVKKAHREKVRANHPDRFTDPDKKAVAEDKTKLINEARDVLLSRKWDPEYGPRTGGYGNPYNNPYTTYRPGTASGGQGYAWPGGFGWTNTYTTNPGTGGTTPTGSGSPQAGQGDWSNIPFTYVWSWNDTDFDGAFDPWEAIFAGTKRKTDKERLDEVEQQLSLDNKVLGAKIVMLVLTALTGNLAIGMFTYAIVTMFYSFIRSSNGCSMWLALPLIVMFGPIISLFAPRAGIQLTGGSLVFFGIALYYDIITMRRNRAQRDALKAKVGA